MLWGPSCTLRKCPTPWPVPAEDAHGILAVHQLRTGFHILDQELHRLARIGILAVVAQAHGCLDLVDILPPGAARTERIPLDVRRVDR